MQRDPSVPRRRRRRPRGIVVLATAVVGMLTMLSPASAHISPVPPPYAAFDLGTPGWTYAGHDLFNTRNNPYEHDINTRNVSSLAPKWTFTTRGVSSSPIAASARSCVVITPIACRSSSDCSTPCAPATRSCELVP